MTEGHEIMSSIQTSQTTLKEKRTSSRRKEEKIEDKIIGPPRLTRYEKARILGARATQLAMGAPPLIEVPPNVKNPLDIAKLELEKGVLPLVIKRKLPNGKTMYIRASELLKLKEIWKPLAYKIIKSETPKS
ncbi:MAG: DNA-directed RNA polymerase subunit K [Thermoprotei archaeon]